MNRILLLSALCILIAPVHGQDTATAGRVEYTKGNHRDYRSLMREGNRQYRSENAEDAERSYRRALDVETSDLATFNLGDALYRQNKFEEAAGKFEEAASSMTDKMDKAQAYHNLGNSYLQQQKLRESIEAYRQALRNNPKDTDTKYNLSYAMRLLKEQEQQQQQQNSNNDSQEQQDQSDQQQNEDQQQQNQQQNNQQQQQQSISREDAQRMLDAIAQDEKELQEKLQKEERAGYRPKIERNW